MFLSQKCRVQTICTIIFRVYCYPMKRKYANGLKYQTQALMGATRLASGKDSAII